MSDSKPVVSSFIQRFSVLLSLLVRRFKLQKQPPRGVLRKRCSEKMQQIYRRTPIPKCDFNKVALQLYSKVPNKRDPPLNFFEKKNPTLLLLLGPPRLLIFGFSSLAPKKIEQFKTYLSTRNSINEIDRMK